jgi:MYXO-CTERM domain-containing protein
VDGGVFGTPRAGCNCAVPAGGASGRTTGVIFGVAVAGLAFASPRRRRE